MPEFEALEDTVTPATCPNVNADEQKHADQEIANIENDSTLSEDENVAEHCAHKLVIHAFFVPMISHFTSCFLFLHLDYSTNQHFKNFLAICLLMQFMDISSFFDQIQGAVFLPA
jgi:hypothetical protein